MCPAGCTPGILKLSIIKCICSCRKYILFDLLSFLKILLIQLKLIHNVKLMALNNWNFIYKFYWYLGTILRISSFLVHAFAQFHWFLLVCLFLFPSNPPELMNKYLLNYPENIFTQQILMRNVQFTLDFVREVNVLMHFYLTFFTITALLFSLTIVKIFTLFQSPFPCFIYFIKHWKEFHILFCTFSEATLWQLVMQKRSW